MVALGYRLIFLPPAAGSPALPGGPLRLVAPHQARMETPLPEVHLPCDPGPDLSGSADAQRLFKNGVGEDKGYPGVPTPVENPRHSSAKISVKQRPTAPEDMAY